MNSCYCNRCLEYENARSTPAKRAALLRKYKIWLKKLRPGDAVKHSDFPTMIGTVIKRMPSSYFYYVRLGGFTWTMNAERLIKRPNALS